MAKKKSSTGPAGSLTRDRAARLVRLLQQLAQGPQSRAALLRRLRLGVRGFYRDLQVLRSVGIAVDLQRGKYSLLLEPATALDQLPFPDPGLTLGEARDLARGRTAGHRKIKAQFESILGK